MAEVSISVRPRQQERAGFSAGLALADISLFQSSDRDLGRRVKNGVIVPVHGSGAPARVDLDVGRYVVSVSMPTGEQLVQELVVPNDAPVSLVLGDDDGLVGAPSRRVIARIESVRRRPRVEANDATPQRVRFRDDAYSPQAVAKSIESDKPVSLLSVGRRTSTRQAAVTLSPQRPQVRREAPRLVDLWSRREGWRSPLVADSGLRGLEGWLAWLSQEASRVPVFHSRAQSEDVLRLDLPRLDRPAVEADFTSDLSNVRPTRRLSQRYVCSVLPDGQVSGLAVAPWKWDSQDSHDPCAVSTFQERDADRGDWRMRIEVQDGRMSSVLAYLTQGDLGSARVLLKSSLRMLMAKVKNPYAAAAGGYVLIYSKSEDIDDPEWPSWIRNLATWYPSSPDAQILMATLCLQRRRLLAQVNLPAVGDDARRLELARILLKRALSAGLPMYSMGMRLLLEDLEILNEEEEAAGLYHGPYELRLPEAIRHVRAVSSCMKTVQPMTVLDFSDISTSRGSDRRTLK